MSNTKQQIEENWTCFNDQCDESSRCIPCRLNMEAIDRLVTEARINSLLDLEQWAKLHNLEKDMILDGIEHMVKSNLRVPDQPRIDHSQRIAELQSQLTNKEG